MISLFSNSNALVHQIHLAPKFITNNHFACYEFVKLTATNVVCTCEVIPDCSIEEGDASVHPFILENVFQCKEIPVNAELSRLEKTKEEKNVIELSIVGEHKNLDYIIGFIKKAEQKTLFGKGDRDWLESVVYRKLQGYVVCEDSIVVVQILGDCIPFKVVKISNGKTASISSLTEIKIQRDTQMQQQSKSKPKILGLEKQANKIMEIMDIVLLKKHKYQITKSLLLWGLEGTGKTSLVREIADKYKAKGVNCIFVTDNLDQVFEKAIETSPCLLVVDDFDVIANKKTDLTVANSFYAMHKLLDDVNTCSKQIGIIAVSKSIDEIDPSFRASGRLEKEIYIPVPSLETRELILKEMLSKLPLKLASNFTSELSKFTPGFVGRDLERLCRQAYFHAVSRQKKDPILEWSDFKYALRVVKPSQLSDFGVSVPSVPWDSIGGYEAVKKRCKEIMYWPIERKDAYERLGLPTNSGLLLYGPPGCGKTLLVQALASLGKMNYISIKVSELFSKYTGETEKIIRNIFNKARQLEPCVLVFDEIDAIAPKRDGGIETDSGATRRALSQLLNEMDGIQNRRNVFIIGCSNRKDLIDSAILRPGRLDQMIYVGLPTKEDRQKIFQVITKKMPVDKEVDFEKLAAATEGFSGADIAGLCREAALNALRENLESKIIQQKHFDKALSKQRKKSV